MSLGRLILCIAIMALVTYLVRALPLAVFQKKITNRYIRSFLAYVPYAVLAAMAFPAVLYSTNSLLSAGIGAAVALVLSWFGKGLLTVALSGAATVFLVEAFLQLFH